MYIILAYEAEWSIILNGQYCERVQMWKVLFKTNSIIVFYIIELQCYSLSKHIIGITDINSLNLLTTFVITYDSIHRDLFSHLLHR